ncbi:MAG: sugar phosphate isomerase/epimerase [Acidobacteriia bacterium]|nr:sugar phosphate isomerase/epimerase [Terriglobia bacterium]
MNRRQFLEAALVAAVPRGLSGAAEPNISFVTEPRARLGVASYPFRAFIDGPRNRDRERGKPGMTLLQFPAMVREKFHVRNIEPLDSHFVSLEAAYLGELRNAVEKAGCRVINIPVGVGESLYDPGAAKRKTGVGNAKKWVDAAVALGSPSLRVHISGVQGITPDVGRAAESLRAVADYGAEKNIVINLENDDPETEDAFYLVKVIEQVNSPWLHGLPDFCNSMLKGDEKYNYDSVTAMFKHAYNISHVKDSEVDNGKVFRVDVGKTFAIAKKTGYRGYFSMEWEGEGGPYEGTQKLIDASLKYL